MPYLHFVKNMERISKIEGFNLELTKTGLIPRDSLIQTQSEIRLPNCSSNLKNVIEKFVDNYLLILNGKYEDFGMSVLHLWMGYIPEDLSTDEELQIFAEDLEKCYNSSDTDNLFVNITTLVITRYLEAVVNFMNESSHDVINLFHCLYVEQTDSRFLMFRYDNNVVENLIPVQPSLNGLTVDRLRLDLAEFIKTNYSQRPCLEDGVLRLMAGSSNIISLNEPTISLANIIRTLLGNSRSNNAKELFFTLHKLILYFTFEAIQKRFGDVIDQNGPPMVDMVVDGLRFLGTDVAIVDGTVHRRGVPVQFSAETRFALVCAALLRSDLLDSPTTLASI